MVGLTKDAGYQVGARRTFPLPFQEAWEFIWSEAIVVEWIGMIDQSELVLNRAFRTKEGIEGKITTLITGSHVRLKWKLPEWQTFSTLQVRIIPSGEKTTISFHQDHLTDEKVRKHMKSFWLKVLDKMGEQISKD
jgi:activator of HSP90 ATPase